MSEIKNHEIASIAKALFFGQVDDGQVFPYPHFTSDQKEMVLTMIDAIDKFAQDQIDSEKFDHDSEVPESVLEGLAALGLCGMAVEEEFGGLELDYSLYSRVFAQVASYDGSIATMLGAHQSIGYRALINEGTKEQKEKWMPKLATGESWAAFCLTEPGSGSDAYSIKTKAIDNKDGTFTINGQKLWITNGGKAEFYSVFCKTEHEIDGKTKEKISCFIVEKEREGVSFGEKEAKMGIKASETRAVYFDNVVVPAENMIGKPGKGFKIAMNVLNTGRLSLGSGCVGGMKSLLKLATAHAKGRKQFGDAISNYGLIQEKLATMAANIYAAESMVYMTTGKMVQGMEDFSIESAMCKVYSSEKLWDTVDKAMQIAAGCGYMKEYPYERAMRDSRINLIFEGTNEILRIFIALMGIRDPGEELKKLGKISDVSKAIQDPIKSLGLLTEFAKNRLGKMIVTKTLDVHSDLEDHAQHFASMLNEFSIKVENVLMKYGKNIIGNELPQMRIANMAIELYGLLSVLSRTSTVLKDSSISFEDKEYLKNLTEIISRDCRKNFKENAQRLGKSYDKVLPKASAGVVARDGYGLDITKF